MSSDNQKSPKVPTGSEILKKVSESQLRTDLPQFRAGDTVKVHAKIIEGTKERVQVFEGIVTKRSRNNSPSATFTVRKVSYDIGVERTFFLHSPRIEKIEVTATGKVRRSKLYYLRDLRGKAAKIEEQYNPEAAAAAKVVKAEAAEAKKTAAKKESAAKEAAVAAEASA